MKLILLLILGFSLSAQGTNPRAVKDSQRRAQLQRSAQSWFESQVLPHLRQNLRSIDGYGVSVVEPRATLPPDLGGPKDLVEVLVQARFSGWMDEGHRRFDRYDYGLPDYGPVNCRFEQRLWAEIDARTGKPLRIMKRQRAVLIYACASSGLEWPDEYRSRRRLSAPRSER